MQSYPGSRCSRQCASMGSTLVVDPSARVIHAARVIRDQVAISTPASCQDTKIPGSLRPGNGVESWYLGTLVTVDPACTEKCFPLPYGLRHPSTLYTHRHPRTADRFRLRSNTHATSKREMVALTPRYQDSRFSPGRERCGILVSWPGAREKRERRTRATLRHKRSSCASLREPGQLSAVC